ncbi:MAG TPA: hypothetical protein VMO26_10380, partial [Vicinamibacterales bacterium]|nr:hypothetical protein [Vicinamibacterales bacterium]
MTLAAVLFMLASPSANAQDDPIAVSVEATVAVTDDALVAATFAKAAAAFKESLELYDQLKKQYGKKTEKWPADALANMARLDAADFRARFERDYFHGLGLEAEGVREAVARMVTAIGKKPGLRVAASPEEADLRLEVLGCVASGSDAVLGVRLSPGGRLDEAAFAPRAPAWEKRMNKVRAGGFWHSFESKPFLADEQNWLIRTTYPSVGGKLPATCWQAAERQVDALEPFIREN